MKKIFLVFAFFIVSSQAFGINKNDAPHVYQFLNSLIDCLFNVNYAVALLETNTDKNDDTEFMAEMASFYANLEQANFKLELALAVLRPYLNKNEIKEVKDSANNISRPILLLKSNNLYVIQTYKKFINGKINEKEYWSRVSKIVSTKNLSYDAINHSVAFSFITFVEPDNREYKAGKIPFILSKEQRDHLVETIDFKFKDILDELQDVLQTGKGTGRLIAVGINALKQNLSYETYEDSRDKNFRPMMEVK